MKLLAPVLLASAVTARSTGWLGSTADKQVAITDDDLSVPGENPLKFCADPKDYILDLESVNLTPNPPEAGKPLVFTAKGNLSQDVTEGAKVHLQVKYGLLTLIKQEADLCEQVKNVDLDCPIKKGETIVTKEVSLPKEIPPGRYTVLADVYTADKEKITCLTAEVAFHRF